MKRGSREWGLMLLSVLIMFVLVMISFNVLFLFIDCYLCMFFFTMVRHS